MAIREIAETCGVNITSRTLHPEITAVYPGYWDENLLVEEIENRWSFIGSGTCVEVAKKLIKYQPLSGNTAIAIELWNQMFPRDAISWQHVGNMKTFSFISKTLIDKVIRDIERCGNLENLSRMTIVLDGDDATLAQLTKQLDKLIDVKKITLAHENDSIFRELLLVKVSAPAEKRSELIEIKDVYKAKIVDLSPETLVLEITGEPNKLDGFVKVIEPYGILEMARTGLTALSRGGKCLNDLVDYNEMI